jgi:NitT/TauT family transport system ATP-binding protein
VANTSGNHFVFDDVSVKFPDGTVAVRDVTLEVPQGQFLALLGPSGCGKSTLLNMASGLLRPSRGRVYTDGVEVDGPNQNVGYVTQKDHLLPWRTVEANVRLPLEFRGIPPAERNQRVQSVLERVGLEGFERHYPKQLSGGMLKRASLSRTMAYRPNAYLMDEPFASLDAQLRTVMHDEFLGIWSDMSATVIFVTHDLTEAITLADRIVVISARPGRIKMDIDVPIPRPRDTVSTHESPHYAELYHKVWSALDRPHEGVGV